MRIAIFGLHEGTQASFYANNWDETWRMAHDPMAATAHRVFEAHSEPICRQYGGDSYMDRLRGFQQDGNLYTLYQFSDWQQRQGCANFWRPQSSVSYIAACAIEAEPMQIGIFGVDLAENAEYAYQRPDMCYMVGQMHGKGITVHIDPASHLFASQWTGGVYGHPDNINDINYRLA